MALDIVGIESGIISGVMGSDPNVTIFKGIPYAAPPIGNLRWRAPQPAHPWTGVKRCDEFSCTSMQQQPDPGSFYQREFYQTALLRSEDCLYLNVWTPAKSSDEKLPVMMWIHGGAFLNGCGHKIEFDGEGFGKKGIILVTINYRTGIFGFLAHPELTAESKHKVSGNYGILDQIAALKWIRKNIQAFGGDPDNITVFGQSAGAKSVEVLISSPLTRGMIRKAIMQSGGGINAIDSNLSLEEAERIGVELCEALEASSIDELRNRSAEEILGDTKDFRPKRIQTGPLFLIPNTDGYVSTAHTSETIHQGNHHDIPYMVGYTSGELKSFVSMLPGVTAFADKQVNLGRDSTYLYCFDRQLPGDDAGAFHSSELWYVFETMDRSWRPFEEVDRTLSTVMSGYWANFARIGDPNGEGLPQWSKYTKESKRTLHLGTTIKMG